MKLKIFHLIVRNNLNSILTSTFTQILNFLFTLTFKRKIILLLSCSKYYS